MQPFRTSSQRRLDSASMLHLRPSSLLRVLLTLARYLDTLIRRTRACMLPPRINKLHLRQTPMLRPSLSQFQARQLLQHKIHKQPEWLAGCQVVFRPSVGILIASVTRLPFIASTKQTACTSAPSSAVPRAWVLGIPARTSSLNICGRSMATWDTRSGFSEICLSPWHPPGFQGHWGLSHEEFVVLILLTLIVDSTQYNQVLHLKQLSPPQILYFETSCKSLRRPPFLLAKPRL